MQVLPLLTQSACGRHAQHLERKLLRLILEEKKKKKRSEKLPESILWSQSLKSIFVFPPLPVMELRGVWWSGV